MEPVGLGNTRILTGYAPKSPRTNGKEKWVWWTCQKREVSFMTGLLFVHEGKQGNSNIIFVDILFVFLYTLSPLFLSVS